MAVDAKSMTIASVARDLKMPETTLRSWRRSIPSISQAIMVANYLGVSVYWLAGEEDKSDEYHLTQEELNLIVKFRKLSLSNQKQLVAIEDTFSQI